MFSFLKKGKKEEKKEKKEEEVKKTECEGWMLDLIIQYLQSPLWSSPISDFLDQHCHLFQSDETNPFNYTTIHK